MVLCFLFRNPELQTVNPNYRNRQFSHPIHICRNVFFRFLPKGVLFVFVYNIFMEAPQGEEKRILFCPKCGHVPASGDCLNIESREEGKFLDIKAEEELTCPSCGYSGKFASVPESTVSGLQFNNDSLDVSAGQAEEGIKRVYLYALGILIIIFIAFQTSSPLLAASFAVLLAGAIFYAELSAGKKRPQAPI